MAKTFDAPLRFLSNPTEIRVEREGNLIHLLSFYERQTLDCKASEADIQALYFLLTNTLEDRSIRFFEKFDALLLGMRTFADMHKGSCLIGDLKPGSLYDDISPIEGDNDPWEHGPSWHEWISTEYIAMEYYSKQEDRRKNAK